MEANLIYGEEIKKYQVKRLKTLTENEEGEQVRAYEEKTLELAIYDKGSKLVKKVGGEDTNTISTIHVYCEPDIIQLHDVIPFNNKLYTILEAKIPKDYTFAKGVSDV